MGSSPAPQGMSATGCRSRLPSAVASAVNRRAFQLAREQYKVLRNDLQAVAWELLDGEPSTSVVVARIEQYEPLRRREARIMRDD